MSLNEIIKSED